jgi:hypothetical protein
MDRDFEDILGEVSLGLLRHINGLEDELYASDRVAARDVGASIPAVLLAIAVEKLSLRLSQAEVSSILKSMVAKVRLGDFHQSQGQGRPCECSSGQGNGNGGGGALS